MSRFISVGSDGEIDFLGEWIFGTLLVQSQDDIRREKRDGIEGAHLKGMLEYAMQTAINCSENNEVRKISTNRKKILFTAVCSVYR